MTNFIDWLETYHWQVAFDLAMISILLFVGKKYINKLISSYFDTISNQFIIAFKNRSEFEQKILLDKYALSMNSFDKLNEILTNTIRYTTGIYDESFIKNGEIPELTELLQSISSRKFLLKNGLYELFSDMSELILQIANEPSEESQEKLLLKFGECVSDYEFLMTKIFGLEKISWPGDISE